MRSLWLIIAAAIVLGLLAGFAFSARKPALTPTLSPTPLATTPTSPSTATPVPSPSATAAPYADPVADFKTRITKKKFGTYVTPQNSSVQPERFTGFHTGVDVEYEDTSADVPVYAIADGTVRRANWTSGYGGLLVIEHTGTDGFHYSLYGHLRDSSLPSVGSAVKKGQPVGVLGTGHSHETDGERRHLHFALITTADMDVRGYVPKESDLSTHWKDPLSLY